MTAENRARSVLFLPWLVLAAVCSGVMLMVPGEETIPYHVAWIGIALAAFYALRMYQQTMHNRLPLELEAPREMTLREGVVIVPLVACIVAIALYPGLRLLRIASWFSYFFYALTVLPLL